MKTKLELQNILLIIINLICLFFILQIKFSLFPLIESTLTVSTKISINILVVDLSIGIILSSFFYVIVVLIPEYRKKSSTMRLIGPRLNNICEQIQISIGYLYSKAKPDYKGPIQFDKLSYADFESWKKLSDRQVNFKYSLRNDNGKQTKYDISSENEIGRFIVEVGRVSKQIDSLFSLPTITSIDKELIDILAELRDCGFYGIVMIYKHWKGFSFPLQNFSTDVFKYYQLYKRLTRYCKTFEFEIT